MVNLCFQYGMKSVPCGPTGTQSWIECLATNQKVRGSNPLRRTRNPDTQQGIGIFAMCGNGEKPCGVRLAPQRCFEANRRLRRLLGRDIPYAVPRPGTKVPGLLFSVKTIQTEKHTRSGVLFDYFSSSLCVLIRRK